MTASTHGLVGEISNAAADRRRPSGQAERPSDRDTARRTGRQAGLLFSGFAMAQGLSFARNAVIGHWLSRGDFGVAASITLILQLIEILSDLGVDRLIIQADDGDDRRLIANAHTLMLARGAVISVVLLAVAWPAAAFFHVPDAAPAFAAIAMVPLVKGWLNLDFRRRQRMLDNRPFVVIECLPQAVALASLIPVLWLQPSYWAVVLIAAGQALVMVAISHGVAERRFQLALDADVVRRMLAFGWPIWLSAIPLVAVYQGDRAIVGHLIGIEALAGYSAAFMVTMVPGLIAAKVGNALMLPLLTAVKHEPVEFRRRAVLMMEITVLAAAAYVAAFTVAGGTVLALAFGPNYVGLGAVVTWLAMMWALRMVQAVPGMALMALGQTRPFLVAGIIRAAALAVAIWATVSGHGLAGVAAAGVIGELASALYVIWRLDRDVAGSGSASVIRLLLLVPALAVALAINHASADSGSGFAQGALSLALAASVAMVVAIGGAVLMPQVRREVATMLALHPASLVGRWYRRRHGA